LIFIHGKHRAGLQIIRALVQNILEQLAAFLPAQSLEADSDHRRLARLRQGKLHVEICIERYHHAIFEGGSMNYFTIFLLGQPDFPCEPYPSPPDGGWISTPPHFGILQVQSYKSSSSSGGQVIASHRQSSSFQLEQGGWGKFAWSQGSGTHSHAVSSQIMCVGQPSGGRRLR